MSAKRLNKILYVEDDVDIQTIVKQTFEFLTEYELKICSDGIEALESLNEFMPDLIILDVMMPKMDGLTTYKKIQEINKFKKIPTIFVTAKAQTHEIETYKEIGAVNIITKPFDPMLFPEKVTQIWEQCCAR